MNRKSAHKDYLFHAILSLRTLEECYDFFEDLCTVKELDEMAKRIRVAKLLTENKVYSEILEEPGNLTASTATISRVNRCIKYGGGGYKKILDRLDEAGIDLPDAGQE